MVKGILEDASSHQRAGCRGSSMRGRFAPIRHRSPRGRSRRRPRAHHGRRHEPRRGPRRAGPATAHPQTQRNPQSPRSLGNENRWTALPHPAKLMRRSAPPGGRGEEGRRRTVNDGHEHEGDGENDEGSCRDHARGIGRRLTSEADPDSRHKGGCLYHRLGDITVRTGAERHGRRLPDCPPVDAKRSGKSQAFGPCQNSLAT